MGRATRDLMLEASSSDSSPDLLLRGGHVIDARNGLSAVRDVAIGDGRIAYDLNGTTREAWDALPSDYKMTGDPRWDGIWR